jgi:beta-N-acetylhexosaminidase
MSEGRGTDTPFRVMGAPWLDSERVIEEINTYNLTGFSLNSISFTPISIPGKSVYPKHMNKKCMGISISITDRDNFYPLMLGIALLQSVYKFHPQEFRVAKSGFLNKLYGSDELINGIFSDVSINDFVLTWDEETAEFNNMITPFRLYP